VENIFQPFSNHKYGTTSTPHRHSTVNWLEQSALNKESNESILKAFTVLCTH